MITCNLKGGLGNQLFEIFTTIAYALSNKDIFFFKNVDSLNGVTKRYTYWNTFFIAIKSFLNNKFMMMDIVREKSFTYEKLPDKTTMAQSIILDGYFQSPKYFEEHYEKIYHLLRIDDLKKRLPKNIIIITRILSVFISGSAISRIYKIFTPLCQLNIIKIVSNYC